MKENRSWTVKLSLELPEGVTPEQYAARVQGIVGSGSVLPDLLPGRSNAVVSVYTMVSAPTGANALTAVGDTIRAGLGVEDAGIFECQARVAS